MPGPIPLALVTIHSDTQHIKNPMDGGTITQGLEQLGENDCATIIPVLVTFGPLERVTTPPRDSPPVQFVAWSPARDPLDADAQAAEEAEARERLWKFHQSRALHLRAAILATQYMFPQDPPQRPED
ncbi:hypothetical protein EDB87DRAFT_1692532 [Lactarius vividus]|nr:hypothetical protein EDB87DRAFT_1692532 [Lactarius vividus]